MQTLYDGAPGDVTFKKHNYNTNTSFCVVRLYSGLDPQWFHEHIYLQWHLGLGKRKEQYNTSFIRSSRNNLPSRPTFNLEFSNHYCATQCGLLKAVIEFQDEGLEFTAKVEDAFGFFTWCAKRRTKCSFCVKYIKLRLCFTFHKTSSQRPVLPFVATIGHCRPPSSNIEFAFRETSLFISHGSEYIWGFQKHIRKTLMIVESKSRHCRFRWTSHFSKN